MRFALLGAAVSGFLAAAAGAAEKPNILVILADDLGYSDLGCYGGEIHTPHVDALARGGVRFTQCYNSARCCPSRASLMTGLYPSQAGIGDFTTAKPHPTRGPGYLGRLNDQCVTLAEVLKPAGYGCRYVGKWHMHEETGPIKRGFDEFYGYTRGHSHDQYDKDYYIRLPENREPELDYPADQFYATDAFNDYALEFIRQGQESGRPWFLFLGHSSPHFPVQAPAERADKYEAVYRRGWDVLREERFARMKRLGVVDGEHWTLTPRSLVPVDRDDIANGFPGQPNPAWDALDQDRQRDLARRMAVFAAMVESVDRGVGRIIEHLETTGDLANTLVLFLSDNGACYEWGPFGFDGPSRRGTTTLRTGDELRQIGGPGTHQSYGSGWANLGNTPLRLYKHFTHEGGICTPLIAHWPKGIGRPDRWVREPVHVMDILPTLLEVTGATYPTEFRGNAILPPEGVSLLPAMRGEHFPERTIGFDHQGARALRKGDWKLVWSKRMPHDIDWELYNLAEDRCETRDLAAEHSDRVNEMAAEWEQWARRVQVIYEPPPGTDTPQGARKARAPKIANRPLTISGRVRTSSDDGVIVAQGGREQGYAIHLLNGRLAFDVRVNGKVTRTAAGGTAPDEFDFEARLTADQLLLRINGHQVAEAASPGLIPVQPKDGLDIGRDERSAAGDYQAPNPLDGIVTDVKVIEIPARELGELHKVLFEPVAREREATPFQDKDGQWWCTAFFNANIPPLPREGIETRDLSEDAQTINEQGVTIAPLNVRVLEDGGIFIRAKDLTCATPGKAAKGNGWSDHVHHTRFNVSKMDQWERVFEYGDRMGMYLHFKMLETENDSKMDGGELGIERKVYTRELIARYAHHLALNWNMGEETKLKTEQIRDWSRYIRAVDPYGHLVVIHTYPNRHEGVYGPLLGEDTLTGTSIQTNRRDFGRVHGVVKDWVHRSAEAGKP